MIVALRLEMTVLKARTSSTRQAMVKQRVDILPYTPELLRCWISQIARDYSQAHSIL